MIQYWIGSGGTDDDLVRVPRRGDPIPRGSWGWAVRVAELVAWSGASLLLILLFVADLSDTSRGVGLMGVGVLVVWLGMLFHVLVPRFGARGWLLWVAVVVDMGLATGFYALLRDDIASLELLFIPAIVAVGLLGRLRGAILAPILAMAGYVGVTELAGEGLDPESITLAAGVFVLSGGVAGVLARELRLHYRAEREEHRLATAVRYRLMAVLDAVDEAIVFSDRAGIVRVVNRRAGEVFEIDPDQHLGLPLVQLQRSLARSTEDPEGYMEMFQQLRDDPEIEIRSEVEQILPELRRLRLYSGPALDEAGLLVGRIDVYTDVTATVRRAAEIQGLYEQARTTAESYQRSLLPTSAPALPRHSFVTHYVPAAGRRAVCGDFYDFVPLSDGRVAVVLADMCGIGPDAVSDAALTRYTLKSLVVDHPDPDKLLERMNTFFARDMSPDRFVRIFVGILDPERAVLEYANAGHVPPALYRASTGDVEWLDERGIPLAVDPDAVFGLGRVELEPGDMFVLYTDGVTEAPRNGKPFGQKRFIDVIERYGAGTPGELTQAIRRGVDAWVGDGELRDDIAMLVCQVVPDATLGEPSRELVLPNEPSRLSEVRAFIGTFLADIRTPVDVATEIELAAGEAAGNACRHARRPDGWSEIRIQCSLEGSKVTIAVADDGPGFDPTEVAARGLPDRFAAGGRGLYLMGELMDDVRWKISPEGTTVTMTRDISKVRMRDDRYLTPRSSF